ncbi:MAG: protein kinase [Planctomycetes bacterium]|nr:protein kinase [Planctomycetota bacterium]
MSQAEAKWPATELGAERFVRRALALLEADFRGLALHALALWETSGTVSPALFEALGNLQRPSFGSFKGLIDSLRKARSTASHGQEQAVAPELGRLLELLDQRPSRETLEALRPLADLCRTKVSGLTLLGLLAMPIALRNDVAHQTPAPDAPFWNRAADALIPLVELHKAGLLGLRQHLQSRAPAVPWFVVRDGRVLTFNGLTHDYAARYSGDDGDPLVDETLAGPVLRSIARMLGEAETSERELKKLLKRLAPEELRGVVLDDYLVGRPVGEGGFATVHLARQLSTGRRVALKILRDSATAEDAARFQKEAEFLSLLNHPNIVQVLGYGEGTWLVPRNVDLSGEAWFEPLFVRGKPAKTFIALEWVEGRTLEEVWKQIAARDPKSPSHRDLTHWLEQAARALEVVHGVGLIHRDIKPSNLMVAADGNLKLMDFGIARSQSAARTIQTRSGEAPGTLAYMSPEQLRMRHSEVGVGSPTDVYSLCATFYELYTGTRIFEWDLDDTRISQGKLDETSHFKREHAQRPAAPRIALPRAGSEVRALLQGGLEPEPKDRPSAGVLASDVALALASRPIMYRPPGAARRMQLAYRRNPLLWNAVAVFVVCAVLGVAAYIWTITQEQARTEEQRDIALENERKEAAARKLAQENEAEAKRQERIAGERAEGERKAKEEAQLRLRESRRNSARIQVNLAQTARKELRRQAALLHIQAARDLSDDLEGEPPDNVLRESTGPLWRTRPLFAGLNVLASPEFGDYYGSISMDATGRLAVAPVQDGLVVWDVLTGDTVASFGFAYSGYDYYSAKFSADGSKIFAAGASHVLDIWDVATSERVASLEGHANDVLAMAEFKSDGLLATTSADRTIRIWDTGTLTSKAKWSAPPEVGRALAFSADGRLLALGMHEGSVAVFNAADGTQLLGWQAHHAQIRDVAWLRDDQQIITAGDDGKIHIWNAATGDMVAGFVGHEGPILDIALSYDERELLSGGADCKLRVWDVQASALRQEMSGHWGAINFVSFTPHQGMVISAALDGTWRFWNAEAAKECRALEGLQHQLQGMVVVPGGKGVAVIEFEGSVALLDVLTGAVRWRVSEVFDTPRSVSASPDGRWIAVGQSNGQILIYRVRDGSLAAEIAGEGGAVTTLAFSPDGRELTAGCADDTLNRFNVGTWQRVGRIGPLPSSVSGMDYLPQGDSVLVACDDRYLRLIRIIDGEVLRAYPQRRSLVLSGVSVSPNGVWAVSGSDGSSVRVWKLDESEEYTRIDVAGLVMVNAVDISPDGAFVLAALSDGSVRLIAMRDGKEVRRFEGASGESRHVAFAIDGAFAIACSDDKSVASWEVQPTTVRVSFDANTSYMRCAAYSPDESQIATCGRDGRIRTFDATTGERLAESADLGEEVTRVEYAPDGSSIACSTDKGRICLLHPETLGVILKLTGHSDCVNYLLFNKSGTELASCAFDGTIRIWSLPQGIERLCIDASDTFRAIAFTPDETQIVTGGATGAIKVFAYTSGQLLRTFDGHIGAIRGLRLSRDGTTLVTCSYDKTARVWDFASGTERHRFAIHRFASPSWVDISADGQKLVCGGDDRTARVWDMATGRLLIVYEETKSGALHTVRFNKAGDEVLMACDGKTARIVSVRAWVDEVPRDDRAAFVSRIARLRLDAAQAMVLPDSRATETGGGGTWADPVASLYLVRAKSVLDALGAHRLSQRAEKVWRLFCEWRSRLANERVARLARQWRDMFEGYRYREVRDAAGRIERVPVPERTRNAGGEYIGEPEGEIDYQRWWDEVVKPEFK